MSPLGKRESTSIRGKGQHAGAAIPAGASGGCMRRCGTAGSPWKRTQDDSDPRTVSCAVSVAAALSPEVPARPTPGHVTPLRGVQRDGHRRAMPECQCPVQRLPSPGAESPETAPAVAPRSSAPVRPSPARPGHSRLRSPIAADVAPGTAPTLTARPLCMEEDRTDEGAVVATCHHTPSMAGPAVCRQTPEVGAPCPSGHAGICAGGAGKSAFLS